MPIQIINTPEEALTFISRLADESERVKTETGKGPGRLNYGPGSVMRAIELGDILAIATDGTENHRIAIWGNQVAGQGIFINHLWGPSGRHLGLLRWLAQKLVDRGFGANFGHFQNIDMPMIAIAKSIVLPQAGGYTGNNGAWVNNANGRLCRVRLSTALTRLIAANAPVEP